MTPDERELISGLFSRLKAAETPDKDAEADDLIRRHVAEAPAAPYLLTQTVLVQEHALAGAQARIADLEKQLADAKAAASKPTSFLGGLTQRLGGSPAPSSPRPSYRIPDVQAAPTMMPGAPPATGGGFLQHALTTAAGVAGGALLFEGVERLLWHSSGPFSGAGMFGSPWGGGQPAENVTVNNYYDDDRHAGERFDAPSGDGLQTADYQTADYDDAGADFGGDGGDYSV